MIKSPERREQIYMANTEIIDGPGKPDEKAEDVPLKDDVQLLFSNTNYIIVFIGIVFIAAGFILMAGGGSSDPTVFDADAIYSFRRITLAPILVLIGFAIEIVAILKKP